MRCFVRVVGFDCFFDCDDLLLGYCFDDFCVFLFCDLQHIPSSTFNAPYMTTNAGAPVWNDHNALTVGKRGDYLLFLVDLIVLKKLKCCNLFFKLYFDGVWMMV